MDIADPDRVYVFLSDDAQDDISGRDRKKMKCRSCGHRFRGEIYGSCRSVSAWTLRKRIMKKMMDIADEKDEFELGIP